MALTYGFYNSLNGDRKYSAKQFGAIFDGIIHDGIYSSIGGRMVVQASGYYFQINIQTGRAWFNHTWTLNDTVYALTLPNPEPLLNKWVAVVLEINEEQGQRKNAFKYVEGVPASNPTYPILTNTANVHQYPLAFCLVRAGATYITQADIVNMVGTSACPYVAGVVSSFNIDELIAQWQAQWNSWVTYVNAQWNNNFNEKNAIWDANFSAKNEQWRVFIENATNEFDNFIEDQATRLDNFFRASNIRIDDFLEDESEQCSALFTEMQNRATQYFTDSATAWDNWFSHYQDELSESQAAHLQAEIDAISYIYIIGETVFLPNTGVSYANGRVTFTTTN